MNIGDGRFGCGDQVQLPQRGGIESLLHCVILIGKFRKLPHAFETLRPDHEWRRDLGVPMLAAVQIQQELN